MRYGIDLDTLSYILHHIVGKVHHKMNACVLSPPNNKYLALSNLKKIVNEESIVVRILEFLMGRVESTVGKGESAGFQYFPDVFPQCFRC